MKKHKPIIGGSIFLLSLLIVGSTYGRSINVSEVVPCDSISITNLDKNPDLEDVQVYFEPGANGRYVNPAGKFLGQVAYVSGATSEVLAVIPLNADPNTCTNNRTKDLLSGLQNKALDVERTICKEIEGRLDDPAFGVNPNNGGKNVSKEVLARIHKDDCQAYGLANLPK